MPKKRNNRNIAWLEKLQLSLEWCGKFISKLISRKASGNKVSFHKERPSPPSKQQAAPRKKENSVTKPIVLQETATIIKIQQGGKGFLSSPIIQNSQGKPLTPHTIKISAVLDHSGTAIDPDSTLWWGRHAKDKKVKAFNGEIGDGVPTTTGDPLGYAKRNPDEIFFSGKEINYVGVASEGSEHYLQYDGHAGFDFPYPLMTPVVAPANGNLYKAASGKDKIYGAMWSSDSDNSFYIEHENGFVTWFRHCVKLHSDIEKELLADFSKSYSVKRGQEIAYVGKVGTWAIHLHFEVRKDGNIVDPYLDKLWI